MRKSTTNVSNGRLASEVVIPDSSESYASSGLKKEIVCTKRANEDQMYQNFISDDSLLEVLYMRSLISLDHFNA